MRTREMTERNRAIYEARAHRGMKFKDIARDFGVSPYTARTVFHCAKRYDFYREHKEVGLAKLESTLKWHNLSMEDAAKLTDEELYQLQEMGLKSIRLLREMTNTMGSLTGDKPVRLFNYSVLYQRDDARLTVAYVKAESADAAKDMTKAQIPECLQPLMVFKGHIKPA